MRIKQFLVFSVAVISLSSCFKDEAPNAECDITKAWVHIEEDKWQDTFFNITDTAKTVMYSDRTIYFTVRPDARLDSICPQFEITEGATISPASGSCQDFSNGPVKYTVTSQDKQWTREYLVNFLLPRIPTSYTFDNSYSTYTDPFTGATYCRWYEECPTGDNSTVKMEVFSNANSGFALSNTKADIEDYPSVVAEGFHGKGIRLTTCSTGEWGKLVRRPLAAGNFFIGEFDVSEALKNTLHTTRMGRPFDLKPHIIRGLYKYKAGDVFWKYVKYKIEEHPEIKDRAGIYAVLYRNRDEQGNEVMLFGEDSKTNPNIVALAEMKEIPETDTWTPFEITFDYYKDIDPDILLRQGYSLTVVFTSSTDGAYYEGAPGSTLYIDDVDIECMITN